MSTAVGPSWGTWCGVEAELSQVIVSRDPIEAKVLQFLERRLPLNALDPVGITDQLSNGVLDSVDLLHLANFIEVTYRIKVEDGDLISENFDTVEKIALFVRRKKARSTRLPFLRHL
jgi:acyl carrier protein